MKLPDLVPLFQPDKTGLCGQTCIAMVAGVTIDEAVQVVRVTSVGDPGTSTEQVIAGLKNFGFRLGKVKSYIKKKKKLEVLPEFAIMSVVDNRTEWGHWVVLKDGFVYDPGIGWPLPVRIYENMLIERAFSRRFSRTRDKHKNVKAYWGEVIPLLGRKA